MKSKKIMPLKKLVALLGIIRKDKKIVTTNGAFDILHAGHVDSLQKAKKLGDILVVLVNTDASVKVNKGDKRPVNSQERRAYVLSALTCVDYVTFFDEKDPRDALAALKPAIHAKGADRKIGEIVEKDVVESNGGRVILLPYLKGYSTTGIITKIVEAYGKRNLSR